MENTQILRQAYRQGRQAEQASFAGNVVARMQGITAYQTLQTQITALATATSHYAEALAAARNRGLSEVLAKNIARQAMISQLDVVATALETLAAGNPQLIVDAGFSLRSTPTPPFNGPLSNPTIRLAVSTGRRGEIRLTLEEGMPKAVRTHAIEYSADRGTTWQNSEYNSRQKFVVSGLPRAADLWIRVKSLGHGTNRSDWSDTVVVAVL